MKKIILFVLLVSIFFTTNVFASDLGRVNIEKINITQNADYNSRKIETLNKNDRITILENFEGFFKVESPIGKTGWIDEYFVDSIPSKYFINTCGYNANIRLSPTTSSKIIGQIKAGEKLKYIDTFHSWYIIEYSGVEGFVASWLGDIVSDGSHKAILIDDSINIRDKPSLEGEIISQGKKYQDYNYLGEEYGWFKLGVNENTKGYVAGWLMSLNNNFSIDNILNFKVTTDNLRLRAEPNLQAPIIKVMTKGSEIRVIESLKNWDKIVTWQGEVGYAHRDYMKDIKPLSGYKILLDPGHGGRDPGAISSLGRYEKNVNLDVSFKLKDILEFYGGKVYMTRTADLYISRTKRAQMADNLGVDIMVSIHHNALNDQKYFGMSTYYDTKNNKSGKESYKLAEAIYDSVVGINSIYRDGIYDRNFEVLRSTNIPASLIEVGFMSNSWEEKNLHNYSFQEEVSKALAFGIIDYFKTK